MHACTYSYIYPCQSDSMQLRLGCILEAASYYADAGSYACRLDNTIAVRYFSLAVSNFVKDGKFKQGAACERVLGEVCKADGAHKDAGMAFVYAAELYMTADDYQQAALMFYQAGMEYMSAKEYMDGRKAFENAGKQADTDNLMRYRAPTFLLSSALALLATGDVPATEAFLLTLCKKFPLFATRREATFLHDILACAKLMDHDAYIDHVWNYDYVKELEPHELEYVIPIGLLNE
jgi:alpha-soluble NSF attachment protein